MTTRPIPGSYGPPVLGPLLQTVSFLRKGWREFYAAREAEHASSVFRSSAGVKAVTVLDQRGIEVMFDPDKIDKLYGFGPLKPPPARIGHIVPTVFENGEAHERQKRWLLDLQARRLPEVFETFDRVATPRFEGWVTRGSFDWGADIDDLYSDFLFEYFLGTRPDPQDVRGWGYELLPRNPFRLPGQGDKPVVERMGRLLAAIRSAPRWPEIARAARDTAGLEEEIAAKQILFYLGFNAYTGLGSVTRSTIGELDNHPDYGRRCLEQVDEAVARLGYDGGPQSVALLEATPLVRDALRESLRLHQPAPFAYGRARKDFVIESKSGRFEVARGEVVAGVIGYAQRDPTVFDRADAFDPDRFEGEPQRQGLVWAHGREADTPGPRDKMCAGRDIVYLALHQFFLKLLHGYRYTLAQRPVRWSDVDLQPANRPVTPIVALTFTRRRPGELPPHPAGGDDVGG